MKVYLLHTAIDFDFGAALPAHHEDLIQDLELTTLLSAMAAGDKFLFDVSRKVLLACLRDPGAIGYRQRILADCLAQPAVIRDMYAVAVAALEDRRRIWGSYGGSYQNPASNLSGAVANLETYVARLRQLRQITDDHADKFRSDGLSTLFATLRRELDDEYFEEISHHLKQLRFRAGVLISAELDRDNSGINFVLREPADAQRTWKERLGISPRSTYSFTLPPRDEAGGQILSDLTSRGVNLVANAAAQSADHLRSYFTMLRAELGFYVSCLNLADRLAAQGVPVSFPEPAPPSPLAFSCADLRDPCLALQSEGTVVGNDVQADGKPLVIITGANSGGKSTFLRSAGLAQLMMQCGLFVAARSYRANVTRGVFTHFESFAGTNEREGSEIGWQVVRALLEAQVTVFFVTHRFDFADRFRRQHAGSTLFLRAEPQPDGSRNYKLTVKQPLPASSGEDLYYRLGGWLDEDKALTPAAAGAAPDREPDRAARPDG